MIGTLTCRTMITTMQNRCPVCGGDGMDDDVTPCPHCDGEGYEWWA